MTTSLYLMQFQPDLRRLLPWAERRGLLASRGGGDLGYAFHGALSEAFGDLAPKPYSYRSSHGLLAYTQHSPQAMQENASLATPEVSDMLGLTATPRTPGLLIRPFPGSWRAGQILSFEVRVRPVQRAVRGGERDVFLAEVDKHPDAGVDRATTYQDWLRRQFEGAARITDATMTQFKLSAVLRRHAAKGDSARPSHIVNGPEAVFAGHLTVENGEQFAQKVTRGIGRHRAFGFGMLLLKPAQAGRSAC
ncbi:type I-E CRISPR-associated protein Cas6/Cse3/CasE [Bordetella genomosp. 13]|uniref:type I-E CRISPR-associated protein Cas6/Cse3/CasE n=1 Tax=Bordetella genomosp. 13 TaxID=463040 RepID=UPI001C92FCFD|nr:type I-E CRISPR-associated protein Cas6/Cse3/CasE [Bordetella genomosp. 13]